MKFSVASSVLSVAEFRLSIADMAILPAVMAICMGSISGSAMSMNISSPSSFVRLPKFEQLIR